LRPSRRRYVAFGTVAVVGLAVCALAGYLMDNGDVDPDIGWVDETEFTYSVTYIRDPYEDPPDVIVIGYWEDEYDWDEMMYVAAVGEIFVDYEYETTLDKTGNWGFKFQVIGEEPTGMHIGPSVYERPWVVCSLACGARCAPQALV